MADQIDVSQNVVQVAYSNDQLQVSQNIVQVATSLDQLQVSQLIVQVAYKEPDTEPDSQARYMRHGKWFNDYGEQPFDWAK